MRADLMRMMARGGKIPVVLLVGAGILIVLAGLLGLAMLGFGLAAVYLWLASPLGPPLAALAVAVVAGALMLTVVALAARLQARATVPTMAELGSDLVRDYPLQSVAAALVAGIAAGGSEQARATLVRVLARTLDHSKL